MTGPLSGNLYTETFIINDSAQEESRANTKNRKGSKDSAPVKISESLKEQIAPESTKKNSEESINERAPVDYSKQLKNSETGPRSEEPAKPEEPARPEELEAPASPEELEELAKPKEPYKDPTDTLTDEEKKQVEELERVDQEIKTHERLHATVGGAYTRGAPTFKMTVGPDGRQYATAGHVDIDVSKGATPEETIRKAQIIKAAATAPASPSSADMMIAAQASQMEAEARAEISQKMIRQSMKDEQTIDDRPIHEKNQSDKLLSLLAVSPPTLNQVLQSMRKGD